MYMMIVIPSNIAHYTEAVIEMIHTYCYSHIALLLMEHQNFPPNNWYTVASSQYRRVANKINNKLKRKYKNKSYAQFLSVGVKPFQLSITDGIHVNQEAHYHLRLKFCKTIRYFIQNN